MIRAELTPNGPYSLGVSGRLAGDACRVVANGTFRSTIRVDDSLEQVQAAQRADGTIVVHAESEGGVEHVRFALGLADDHSEFLRRFARDPLLGETVRRIRGLRPVRTGTVAQALLRAVAGQLILAKRARQIERSIVRAATPALDGLHAAPTCRELGAFSPAQLARHGLGARRAGALIRLCRSIDLERLKARGFVTPDAPKSQIADEFRVIKRPIIHNARRAGGEAIRNGNLVMVTSALPGEGKTFTAVNLAMSVAMELDTTVLLVDGDVAHPELPRVLGTPGSPGLLELLTTGEIDVSDAILRTNVENLSVLPAGAHHRRATELLASEQMAAVLHELATRYPDRIVIFDSPPLLPTTEARALALHMGQIVMVVAADSTRQQAVNLALATIENCDIVLMMLNKADKTDVGTYYGYYADDEPR